MNRQFPPEIVQLIVEASLDRYDMFRSHPCDIRLRYATLRSYSLLNSTWGGASQAQLVKRVEIRTQDSAEKFMALAQQRGGTLGGVQDMFIDWAYFTESTIAKLLRCARQVINLRLYRGSVDIFDLAQLQQLRRVELDRCVIDGSPSSSLLRLPHLQRIEITGCRVEDSALHFLTPAFLPQLRRVDVDALVIIAPLIRQLEIVNNSWHDVDYAILAHAESLLLLPLPFFPEKRLDMLAKLPSLPPFLHAAIPPYEVRNILDAHQEFVEALEDLSKTKKSGLRVILVNDYGIDDSIKGMIPRFQERGIRVQLVDEEMVFHGAIEEMETILAGEKRAREEATKKLQ